MAVTDVRKRSGHTGCRIPPSRGVRFVSERVSFAPHFRELSGLGVLNCETAIPDCAARSYGGPPQPEALRRDRNERLRDGEFSTGVRSACGSSERIPGEVAIELFSRDPNLAAS
jgi:hypothetical protein